MNDPTSGDHNPYAPPETQSDAWRGEPPPPAAPLPPGIKPGLPKVFGILSIIFASLVLMIGLFQSCSGLVSQGMTSMSKLAPEGSPNAAEMKKAFGHMASAYLGIGIQGLILALMSGVLLAVGIGQLRYRRWARKWSLIWGWLGLIAVAGMVAISFLIIGPAYQRFFADMAAATPSGAMPAAFSSSMSSLFGGTMGVMTVIFYGPWPILLLIFFSRDHIAASMDT